MKCAGVGRKRKKIKKLKKKKKINKNYLEYLGVELCQALLHPCAQLGLNQKREDVQKKLG